MTLGLFEEESVVVDGWAWLPKRLLSSDQLSHLKRTLTMRPRKVGDHPGEPPEPFPLFVETDSMLGVPREYFFTNNHDKYAVEVKTTLGAPWPGPIEFAGEVREDQKVALAAVRAAFRAGRYGGIIQAYPAFGKTVASCALIAELKVPTLVIVHKEFLLNQWCKRIAKFLPEAKVGVVQQDECDFQDKHVVVAMVHSLVARDYGSALWRHFGMTIWDEVHHAGAPGFSQAVPKFAAKWRIGLSATPRRKDGTDNAFWFHIGPVLFVSQDNKLKPKVRRVWTSFCLVKTPKFNPSLATKQLVLRFLCASDPRNQLIVEQLILAVQKGRKVLLVSERLKHLSALKEMFQNTWTEGPLPTTGLYVGGLEEEEREEAIECQVIFATSQLVAEGFDVPQLDTLMLTTPLSDVEQAIGRIQRLWEGKKDPVVVDFRDDKVARFKKMGEYRDKLYLRLGL